MPTRIFNRKIKKTPETFEKDLHRCLGKDSFKGKYSYRTQGKLVSVGKIFLGFKYKQ